MAGRSAVALCCLLFVHADASAAPEEAEIRAFDEAIELGMYGEAENIAKAKLAVALAAGRDRELDTADVYSDLAKAQRLGGNPDAAVRNYELAVSLLEAETDMLNLALERPLFGIGVAQLDAGRADEAIPILARAIHVRQVNNGPHNLVQVPMLVVLAKAYRRFDASGEVAQVAERVDYLLNRHAAQTTTDTAPYWLQLGEMYRSIDDYRNERNAYTRLAALVRDSDRLDDKLVIEPYVRIGESYVDEYFDAYHSAADEEALPDKELLADARESLELARAASEARPAGDWQLQSRVLLALGDFYTVTDEFSEARQLYRQAWALLTADPERVAHRQQELESAVPLLQPLPGLRGAHVATAAPDDEDSVEHRAEIVTTFTITRRGRLSDIGLLESTPERMPDVEAKLKRSLQNFVYRPRMENGFVTDTPDQVFRYSFPYSETAARKN